jgi:hypothetical protein
MRAIGRRCVLPFVSCHPVARRLGCDLHDSDAISDSRNRPLHDKHFLYAVRALQGCAPGMMYVSDRSADSICDTALLFLVMKSEYMPSHCVGIDSTSVVRCVACLYIAVSSAPGDGDFGAWLRGWCVVLSGCGSRRPAR